MIICGVGYLILLIGASCVVVVGRYWTICCYIVGRLVVSGALSFGTFGISWVLLRSVADFFFGWWN